MQSRFFGGMSIPAVIQGFPLHFRAGSAMASGHLSGPMPRSYCAARLLTSAIRTSKQARSLASMALSGDCSLRRAIIMAGPGCKISSAFPRSPYFARTVARRLWLMARSRCHREFAGSALARRSLMVSKPSWRAQWTDCPGHAARRRSIGAGGSSTCYAPERREPGPLAQFRRHRKIWWTIFLGISPA